MAAQLGQIVARARLTGLATLDKDAEARAALDKMDASAFDVIRQTVAASLDAGYASSRIQESPDLAPSMGESHVPAAETVST